MISKKKKLVVVKADAVVDPWTMVVHLENADAANTTVVGTVWLVLAAPLAVPAVARPFLLLELYVSFRGAVVVPFRIVSWNLSRMGQYTHRVAEKEHHRNVIE